MPGKGVKYYISSGEELETYFKWLSHIICKLQLLAHFKQEVPVYVQGQTHKHTHCRLFQGKPSTMSYKKSFLVNQNHYQLAVSEEKTFPDSHIFRKPKAVHIGVLCHQERSRPTVRWPAAWATHSLLECASYLPGKFTGETFHLGRFAAHSCHSGGDVGRNPSVLHACLKTCPHFITREASLFDLNQTEIPEAFILQWVQIFCVIDPIPLREPKWRKLSCL